MADTAQSLPQTLSLDELESQVEKDLFAEILKHIENQEMTLEEAQKLAKEFVTLLPIVDKQDLLTKLQTFSEQHAEAGRAYIKLARTEEEEKKNILLNKMREHIKNGDLTNAIAVAKGGSDHAGRTS